MHEPNLTMTRLLGTRIVATPEALDAAEWSADTLVLRFAPDEVFIVKPPSNSLLWGKDINTSSPLGGIEGELADPHAIVVSEGSFSGLWLDSDTAMHILEHGCEWEIPSERPAFAQGAVAGIPAKLWFEAERVLIIVPAPLAAEFEERIG